MKICPVCKAIAFDDASICYGCLHQFEPDGADSVEHVEGAPAPVRLGEAVPEFLIRFTPALAKDGGVTWSCAVETAR